MSCRTIPEVTLAQGTLYAADYTSFTQGVGHFNVAVWGVPGNGVPDAFRMEVVYPNDVGPTPPVTANLSLKPTYRSCDVCVVYFEGCADPKNCNVSYLATSGTATVTRADRATTGRLAGSASSLTLEEWDLTTDRKVGNRCVTIGAVGSFDVSFPP